MEITTPSLVLLFFNFGFGFGFSLALALEALNFLRILDFIVVFYGCLLILLVLGAVTEISMSQVSRWVCESHMRSWVLLSASENSIESIPSPVYQ